METVLSIVLLAVFSYIVYRKVRATQKERERLPKGTRVENPDIYDPFKDDRRDRR